MSDLTGPGGRGLGRRRAPTRFAPVLSMCALALALLASACTTGSSPSDATELRSSGATFPKAFYEQAIYEQRKVEPSIRQAYAGGGSGKGRQDLADQLVDWAGTDGLVKDADRSKFKGGEFMYIPTVAAPIAVAYRLPVADLQLSPATIAGIFQAKIKKWNDPAIAADNPRIELPNKQIIVARRSDGSGTTENFTKFLVAAAPDAWALGSGSTVEWPGSTQGGNGNAGVGQIIKSTEGAVGYIEFSDAKALGLRVAAVRNKTGRYVSPSLESASAALAGAKVKEDLTYNPLWADGDDAYPITAPTWIIVYRNQTDPEVAAALKTWLRYVLTDGQSIARAIDFAPLPDDLAEAALVAVEGITVPERGAA